MRRVLKYGLGRYFCFFIFVYFDIFVFLSFYFFIFLYIYIFLNYSFMYLCFIFLYYYIFIFICPPNYFQPQFMHFLIVKQNCSDYIKRIVPIAINLNSVIIICFILQHLHDHHCKLIAVKPTSSVGSLKLSYRLLLHLIDLLI